MPLFAVLCIAANAQSERAPGDVPFDREHFTDKDGLQAAQSAMKEGDKYFSMGGSHFGLAIPPYEKAYAFNPNSAELNMKLGLCYLNSRYRHLSLPYFKRVVELDPEFPRVHYLTAYAYQLSGQWDDAIAEFQKHEQATGGMPDPIEVYNMTSKRIAECKNGKALSAAPVAAQVENMGQQLNSEYSDYGVLFGTDGNTIYFTSRRPNTTGGKMNKATNEYFEDIYVSTRTEGEGWSEPAPLAGVNTMGNDATIALCNKGNTLLVYRDSEGTGDIWQSDLVNGAWGAPVKLGESVNSKDNESSAFISPDGQWLYFVSDREGGLGGQDVYRCQWSQDQNIWGAAENLGPDVNTGADEDGVYMDPAGTTLYFSSMGHNSIGGFDLFKCTLVNEQWTRPENLGWPINGADDDLFYVLDANGTTGYFSSVRSAGWGDDDIYRIVPTPTRQPDPELTASAAEGNGGMGLVHVHGKLMDLQLLDGMEASVDLIDLDDAGMSHRFRVDASTGEFDLPVQPGHIYALHASADGFMVHSENIMVPEEGGDPLMKLEITLKRIEPGAGEVMRNMFFQRDKAKLERTSLAELGQLLALMRGDGKLRIEVSGHTDSDGSAEHNQTLSEARAQAVVDHLMANGISAERLEVKGYGATQPVAPNDTDANKALNRRTEIRVIAN